MVDLRYRLITEGTPPLSGDERKAAKTSGGMIKDSWPSVDPLHEFARGVSQSGPKCHQHQIRIEVAARAGRKISNRWATAEKSHSDGSNDLTMTHSKGRERVPPQPSSKRPHLGFRGRGECFNQREAVIEISIQ
jgi:hypothetical protein